MTSRHIREVLQTGERHETLSTTLVVRLAYDTFGQLACVVGKKVHHSAVVRHRYQRLLRAAARAVIPNTFAYDMVIVAKPHILHRKKLTELQAELQPYFEKLT